MQKSLFFMKTLRCTAGELYDTHKGTLALDFGGAGSGKDWVFAPFDLKIVHIDKAANTVFFQSLEEVEAPGYVGYISGRFAHCDDDDLPAVCKVGEVIYQGEPFYMEGGKAGGVNGKYATHVHAVFASGRLLSPYWYNVGNGNYALRTDGDQLHIYDAVFVPEDVPIVATNDYKDAYPWQRISKEEEKEEEKKMNIALFWEDDDYKLTAFEGDGLASISSALKKAQDFGDVRAISGGPFFDGSTILGRLQGVNCNRTHDQNLFDVAIDVNGMAHRGKLASWEFQDNVQFGFTPRMMLIAGGVYSNESGGAIKPFADTYADHFLFVVQDWSNRLGLGITRQRVTVAALRDFFLKEQMQYLWLCDGGGSTQLIGDGETIAPEGTSRKLPAFFVLIKEKEAPEPEPEPAGETMVFRCIKGSTSKGYPLRSSAPSGPIVGYLKPGDFVKVVDILNKGKNQYTSSAEPWCLTDGGLWFSFDKNYFE